VFTILIHSPMASGGVQARHCYLSFDEIDCRLISKRPPLGTGRQLEKALGRFLSCISIAVTVACLFADSKDVKPRPTGPVYVPLDSWVYPALKRLAALGYAPDEESLAAPWTREQCAELVNEAEDFASRHSTKVSMGPMNEEVRKLIIDLKKEFGRDNGPAAQAQVESLYGRVSQIGGAPLRDSYHFGQTLVDDYGRPFENGTNAVAGFSAYATAGRFSGYFRGEYQEAGGRAPLDENTRTLLGTLDGVPTPVSVNTPSISRFDPLEMYAGVKLGAFDITFGKQSLWWGPGEESAFAFTNNAEPFYSMRLSQLDPFILPGPFRYLGRIRTQMLVGKLSGHNYPPRPLINAQKITLQVTENLEFGFTRSAIFGGVGHPLTARSIFNSFFSTSSTGSTVYGSANDPGDRRSGFDFRWRLPGLRHLVTIYSDSLADDEPNPLSGPRRSAWAPGIYFTRLPAIRNLDFRFETYSTWLYRGDAGGMFLYWNDQYRDAYTNNQYLLGSWVGRDARAYLGSSTYWWSAKNKLTASFRQIKTGNDFLPGGGTQTDASVNCQWELKADLLGSVLVQYERYLVPSIGGSHRDLTVELQLVFYPRAWGARK
jgi:hypothetical protein